MLEFNIQYFETELKMVIDDIKTQELANRDILKSNSEVDTYSRRNSEYSEADTNSMASMSNDNISGLNDLSDKDSNSISSGKNSTKRVRQKLPEVTVFGDSNKTVSVAQVKDRGLEKKLTKSKFGSFVDGLISNKRLFSDTLDPSTSSSKRLNRYDHEVGAYSFLKGNNTVPLVSELTSLGIRNDNMLEVYERLKFFANECFRIKETNDLNFMKILKETDLYLKSYEDQNEDSDWDSDEEVASVILAKELKSAIEEKTNLSNELNEVEKSLIACNSSNSKERESLSQTNSLEIKDIPSPKHKNVSSYTSTDTTKTAENVLALEDKSKSLYKNVLTKGKDSISGSKPIEEKKSSSLLIKGLSESLDQPSEDDSPCTPKVEGEKITYTSRHSRKGSMNTSFNPRSSSIHSFRSNKAAARKVKKKKLTDGKLKRGEMSFNQKEYDSGESSDSIGSIDMRTNSPSSAKIKKEQSNSSNPGLDSDPKLGKGLSSFARVKTGNKKKTKVRKVRKFKSKKSGKFNNMRINFEPIKNDKLPDIIGPAGIHKLATEGLHSSGVKNSSFRKPIMSMDVNSGSTKKIQFPELNKSTKNIYITKDPDNRRKNYKLSKRGSAMKQVSSFMNVFNSFANDDMKVKAYRKPKKSSNVLNIVRNESSNLLPSYLTDKIGSKDRTSSHRVSLKQFYRKNRSRSALPFDSAKQIKHIIRRTMSDFHE